MRVRRKKTRRTPGRPAVNELMGTRIIKKTAKERIQKQFHRDNITHKKETSVESHLKKVFKRIFRLKHRHLGMMAASKATLG